MFVPFKIIKNVRIRSSKLYNPEEYKALLRLGVPITVGQIGMTIQGLADTIMVGRHSTAELAAAGFVNNLFMLAILLCVGFTMGAISQLGSTYAQGRKGDMVSLLKSSLVADGMQCLVVMILMGAFYVAMPYLGQPEELLPLMKPYYLILFVSLPFISMAGGMRLFFDSKGDTWVSMAITLAGNVWNIVFNVLWIFGLCGFPEMGLIGAGWATLTSRIVMLLLYAGFYFLMPRYREYRNLWRTEHAKRSDVMLMNRLGWPTGIQQGMEAAAFSLCAILLGWIGASALAAHQVMLNVAMTIYLFYIGIGSAVSIRVSNFLGLADRDGIRRAATSGFQLIMTIGIITSSIMIMIRHNIGGLFTDSQEVSDIVSTLVWPMIFYQFGDGTQTNYVNVLRGLGDVKPLMRYSFIAYIVISLPLSYLFGNLLRLGAFGVWMGFPVSLTTAAILYVRRYRKVMKNFTEKY
jgi:MATE family multidrug resistance protein